MFSCTFPYNLQKKLIKYLFKHKNIYLYFYSDESYIMFIHIELLQALDSQQVFLVLISDPSPLLDLQMLTSVCLYHHEATGWIVHPLGCPDQLCDQPAGAG